MKLDIKLFCILVTNFLAKSCFDSYIELVVNNILISHINHIAYVVINFTKTDVDSLNYYYRVWLLFSATHKKLYINNKDTSVSNLLMALRRKKSPFLCEMRTLEKVELSCC